jgi:hypothetical protein
MPANTRREWMKIRIACNATPTRSKENMFIAQSRRDALLATPLKTKAARHT